MVALWYALVLAPFVAIPFFWWSYQRKQAARERLANERWQSVVQNADKGAADATDPGPAVNPAAAVTRATPSASTSGTAFQRRERVLGPAETLAFYLLRSGLPECEVLAGVRLDRLVTVAQGQGPGSAGRMQGLAQHAVDFVICNKAMQPLAAVDVIESEAGAALTAAPDFKTQCLAQAGIRYVRVLRSALPKREDVRAVVLGPVAAD